MNILGYGRRGLYWFDSGATASGRTDTGSGCWIPPAWRRILLGVWSHPGFEFVRGDIRDRAKASTGLGRN